MKNHLTLIVIIVLLVYSADVKSQDGMEDVIHLKNGYIYRGVIIERGTSLKVKMSKGYVATIDSATIGTMTREPKLLAFDSAHQKDDPYFTYKNKGVFFQGELLWGFYDLGVGATLGYKFNQFARFGVGANIQYAAPLGGRGSDLGRGYLPVYFQYGGDVLKKEFTPIYWMRFGYAWSARPNINRSDNESADHAHYTGGYTGGLGIGARYYSPYSIFSCSWTLGYVFIHASSHEWGWDQARGGTTYYDYKSAGYVHTLTTMVTFGF